MALTVENGAGVDGADSYISLDDARTYATTRGLTLAEDDDEAEIQLRQGFDYIEAPSRPYRGRKAVEGQPTQWPRDEVYLSGASYPLDSDVIPVGIRQAQVRVAAAVNRGLVVFPDSDGAAFVTREKVGLIDTEYSDKVAVSGVPLLRSVEALLDPFYAGLGGAVAVERA